MVSGPRGAGPTPRQRRAVATRRRLYEAAMAEYARVGLEAARVEDIVAAAEVSWGTFFHYFPAKEDVLLDAAAAIPGFGRPVLLVWGEECGFFPMSHARRLASDFPDATLVPVPGAKTWVPVDNPAAVAEAIGTFVPTSVP